MNSSYKEKHYNEYDEDPILYCKKCLSLNIRTTLCEGENIDYCDICGGVDIAQCDIRTWEKMYKKKYGREYIDRTKVNIYF